MTIHVVVYSTVAMQGKIHIFSLFPDQVTIKLTILLCSSGGNVNVKGLVAIKKEGRLHIQTEQVHCAQATQSSMLFHSIVDDHGIFDYDGMIRIEKDAAGSYALQNNKNILLSSTAMVKSVPNIEVLHHDVQCYHGAAIGKFDKEHMLYLQSRGIAEEEIQKILIRAFSQMIIDDYENKEFILHKLYEKL